MLAYPYGVQTDGTAAGKVVSAVCVNAEPGTFGHECGKPANNIGHKDSGFRAMFCDECRDHGHEAKAYKQWSKLT